MGFGEMDCSDDIILIILLHKISINVLGKKM